MRMLLLAFAIVAGLAAAAAADDSDPKAKAAAEYAEGQRLYDATNYTAAAAKFKAAWAIDPDPAYLFNIAQALRFAKQCGEAADYYRKFLAQVTSAPNLDKVHDYLAEVDACAKAQQPQQQPEPPHQEPPRQLPSMGKTAGLIVGGLGVAMLGVGLFFNYDTWRLNTNHDNYIKSCTQDIPCSGTEVNAKNADYSSRGTRAQALGLTFDIAGGAAIAAGAIVYFIRVPRGEQPPIAVAPMRGGGAMVSTGWRF